MKQIMSLRSTSVAHCEKIQLAIDLKEQYPHLWGRLVGMVPFYSIFKGGF